MTQPKRRVGVLMMQNATQTYIDRCVWRWLAAAGATIVPIPPTVTAPEAAAYFEYVHGLFLHPGWADKPAYTAVVDLFLTLASAAAEAGDYFPVWGTCQGMQRIMQAAGGRLENLKALRYSKGTHVELQGSQGESRLLSYATDKQYEHLKYEAVPWFHHEYGVRASATMRGLRILATSHDREGTEYVSMIEGKGVPIYGVQFHPEKKRDMAWMADFFVAEMKKSKHVGFDPRPDLRLTTGVCKEPGLHMDCLLFDS